MAKPGNNPQSAGGSEIFNLLHLIFTVLAGILFLAGIGVLVYQLWGLVSGSGWVSIPLGAALDYLVGPPPQGELSLPIKILAVLSLAPLGLSLMLLAWVLNAIGNGLERLG